MNKVASSTKEEGNKKAEKAMKYILLIRRYKAAKAARLSGVAERTGRQWAKRLRDEHGWDIFVMIRYNHLYF